MEDENPPRRADLAGGRAVVICPAARVDAQSWSSTRSRQPSGDDGAAPSHSSCSALWAARQPWPPRSLAASSAAGESEAASVALNQPCPRAPSTRQASLARGPEPSAARPRCASARFRPAGGRSPMNRGASRRVAQAGGRPRRSVPLPRQPPPRPALREHRPDPAHT